MVPAGHKLTIISITPTGAGMVRRPVIDFWLWNMGTGWGVARFVGASSSGTFAVFSSPAFGCCPCPVTHPRRWLQKRFILLWGPGITAFGNCISGDPLAALMPWYCLRAVQTGMVRARHATMVGRTRAVRAVAGVKTATRVIVAGFKVVRRRILLVLVSTRVPMMLAHTTTVP